MPKSVLRYELEYLCNRCQMILALHMLMLFCIDLVQIFSRQHSILIPLYFHSNDSCWTALILFVLLHIIALEIVQGI